MGGKTTVDGFADMFQNGVRHGKGTLTYSGGLCFKGDFEKGRPLEGGTFSWPDGVSTKLVIEERFDKFLGPGSNPAAWEVIRPPL